MRRLPAPGPHPQRPRPVPAHRGPGAVPRPSSTSATSATSSSSLVPKPRRRVNTDPIGPYLDGLSLIRLGLRDPGGGRGLPRRRPRPGRGLRPLPPAAGRPGARSTSTSRSTAPSSCSWPTATSAAGPRPAAATSWSTSSRTSRRPTSCSCGCWPRPASTCSAWATTTRSSTATPAPTPTSSSTSTASSRPPPTIPWRSTTAARWRWSTPPATCSPTTDRRVPKEIRPGPDADPTEGALTVRLHPPDGGAAAVADVVTGWLAEPGVDRGRRRRAGPGQLPAPRPPGGPGRGRACRSTRCCGPASSSAPACGPPSPTCASAPIPDDIDGADVVEVYRRPSRGFPQWFPKWLRGRLSLDRLAAMADRIDDVKVGAKVERAGGRPPAGGGGGRAPAPPPAPWPSSGTRSAWAGPWACSTRPGPARAGRATSTTSRPWPRWPPSTPTRPRSSRGCGTCSGGSRPPAG